MTSRRRQRSSRLSVAAALLATSAILVTLASLAGTAVLLSAAGAASVLMGVAATRITHDELVDSRREASRDRARLAGDYRRLTETRVREQSVFADATRERLERYEELVASLDRDLSAARAEAAAVAATERRRAADAEDRAARAIVRVAELEQELDVIAAEWQAVVAKNAALLRKHA